MKQLHTVVADDSFNPSVGGLHSTMRLGSKWKDLEIGEEFELTVGKSDTERKVIGLGVVRRIEYLTFAALQERHWISNHSSEARKSPDHLWLAMFRAYGTDFDADKPVTVVFYRRKS